MGNVPRTAAAYDLTGKLAIVTGASSGLGLATAKKLLARNARVICTVRDEKKGVDTLNKLNNNNAEYMVLEMDSFDSVKRFADDFNNKYSQLNILVNNAGVAFLPKFEKTIDGYERTYQVNYLSQHYLTTLLLQQLIESEGKSNIVNVSSPLYKVAKDEKVLHEQWNDEAKYQIAHAYGYSKLALMMDSYQLNKNLIQQNLSDQVSINCVNPGGVDSQIFRNLGTRAGWFLSILKMAGQLKDAEAAAEYIINVCQEPKSGGYYDEWTRRELDAVIPKYNLARAHELWNQAELVTNK